MRDRLRPIHHRRLPVAATVLSFTVLLGSATACTDANTLREQRYSMAYLVETGECPGCNLQGIDFTTFGAPASNLSGANLRGANFEGLTLSEINFSGADLRQANLSNAIVTDADFRGADLRGANLDGTDLENALIEFAQLDCSPGTNDIYRPTPARILDQVVMWLAFGLGGVFLVVFIPFVMKLNQHLNESRAKRLYQEGVQNLQTHHYAKAIAHFTQAIALKTTLNDAYLDRGRARLRLGQLDRVQADIDQFLATEPSEKRLDGLLVRGELLLAQREYRLALQQFNTTLHDYPAAAAAMVGRGVARRYLGDYHGSIDDLTQAIEREPDARTYIKRSELSILLGHDAEALDDLAQAATLSGHTAEIQYYQGLARYNMGDRQEAKRHWQSVIDLPHSTVNPNSLAALKSAHLIRGMAYYRLGQQKLAIQDGLAALKIDGNYIDAQVWVGLARLAIGNTTAAINDFSAVIRLAPIAENFYHRAVAYWLDDNIEGAIANLNRVIQQSPSTASAHYLRWLLNTEKQNVEEAQHDYQHAVEWEAKSLAVRNDLYGCYARSLARLKMTEAESAEAIADLQSVDQQCKDTNHVLLAPKVAAAIDQR
jgi:tetratricopeptide (TPR) repeat protein